MEEGFSSKVPALFEIVERQISGDTIATVDARDLHAFLEVGRDFSNWIKDRIEKYSFTQDVDFVISPNLANNDFNGLRSPIDYHLSLDMAKELAMVERNAKGKQARQYFIECERRLKERPAKPMTMAEILVAQAQLLVEVERRQASLEAEQRALDARQVATENRLIQIETASDWFTSVGYARWAKQTSLDLKDAAKLGAAASRFCKKLGIVPSQIPDPRFGVVNQYPKSVLDEAWSSVFGGAQ